MPHVLELPASLKKTNINTLLLGGMHVHTMACLDCIPGGTCILAMVCWSRFPGTCVIMPCTLWCRHDRPAVGPEPLRIQPGKEGVHIGKPPACNGLTTLAV